ncbi:MAG: patatin-like phospholipase family protein [Anaerolinea sp.]|nr:patatin-like phospholipase family protein [Anaerolinea sp.]
MTEHFPILGIALGGGGARGLAHIGVLKVLQQAGIFPRLVAGTSMGGIVGAMYARGMSAEQMEAAVQRAIRSRTDILRAIDLKITQTGFVRGARIYDFIADMIGPEVTFAQLHRPLAVVATDMNTGREVVLDRGRVADAVRATISVPGVFLPVELGAMRLVDGGMLNNLPVDVVRRMGAQIVIAVDVLPNFQANTPGQPPVVAPLRSRRVLRSYNELWNAVNIMISASTQAHLQQWPADVVLQPALPPDLDILFGFDRSKEAIAAGEAAAEAALERIQALIVTRNS